MGEGGTHWPFGAILLGIGYFPKNASLEESKLRVNMVPSWRRPWNRREQRAESREQRAERRIGALNASDITHERFYRTHRMDLAATGAASLGGGAPWSMIRIIPSDALGHPCRILSPFRFSLKTNFSGSRPFDPPIPNQKRLCSPQKCRDFECLPIR